MDNGRADNVDDGKTPTDKRKSYKKLKLVESKQFCTHGVHVQHSKAERYHTGANKFTDIITAVHGIHTELSLFSAYPLLSAYYLTIYIYRRLRLTTGVYGIHVHVSTCTCISARRASIHVHAEVARDMYNGTHHTQVHTPLDLLFSED